MRTLVETGVVVGNRGAFRLEKSLDAIQVPATVQAVLAARIDRLQSSVKHLLQSAAVIGKTVPFTLLEAVAETSALELRRGLTQLQAAEFLYETSLFPEREYTFKHALTLEVTYQNLLRERRRLLHAAVLSALESRASERGQANAEVLAHHAVRGEVWTSAASYLFRAGAKAQAEARYATAMTFYEACVDVIHRLGEAGDRRLEVDAYLEVWSTRISTGLVEGLAELGSKVETLARALDDGPRLARVQVRQAQAVALATAIPGTLSAARERAREAATRADPVDLRTRSYARFIAAVACRDLGRIQDAIEEYDLGTALFTPAATQGQEPGLVYPICVSLGGWRSEAFAALGNFDAARASATEALRVANEIRHGGSLTIANAFLGYVTLLQGHVDTAIPILERGLIIGEEHDIGHGICANAIYLGWAFLLAGQQVKGLDLLQRGLDRTAGAPLQWTRFGSVTAMAYLAAGRHREARAVIAAGLTAVAEREALGYRAPLLRLEAEVLLAEGEAQLARERVSEALSCALELGTRPEVGHCHATLAAIARQLGDAPAAHTHRAAAGLTFEQLGMTSWDGRLQGC